MWLALKLKLVKSLRIQGIDVNNFATSCFRFSKESSFRNNQGKGIFTACDTVN